VEPVVAVIQTLLLKAQMPELTLRPGASIVARVLSRGEAHGVLVIAGVPLTAQLPEEVGAAGETLRLTVREVTAERVTLQLDQAVLATGQPPPAARARVTVEEPPRSVRAGGEERASVALSFHSEPLGRLDIRIDLVGTSRDRSAGGQIAGTRVRTAVQAASGRPYDLAAAAAGRLEDGLHARTGLAAEVRVTPRREPLDVYA
jgi:hypothetical protein